MNVILNYLKQSIDDKAHIEEWNAKQYLNLQLAGSYDYYLVTVLTEPFLLIKPKEMQTIQKIKTHILRIREMTEYEIAILLEDATPYYIKKMLEERIAFLALDKQMYLPFLALHIKKKQGKKIETEIREKFTAATQMIFLALLYSDKKVFSTEELAEELKLSVMTILRATDELKRLGLVSCETGGQTGRKKWFRPIEKKRYYCIGREYLINPVKKRCYVKKIPDELEIFRGGMTALAEQTMLAEPTCETYAFYGKLQQLEEYRVSREEAIMEELPEIQLMQYDIGKLTNNRYIDPVTLIMSLDEKDDRVEIAIEELIGEMEWYEE